MAAGPDAPTRFYSPSVKGFFSSDVNTHIPEDAIEITEEHWNALIEEQSTGKQIVPDTDGRPIAIERVWTPEERTRSLLRQRDIALRDTDWLVSRHRDEMELSLPTTLTPDVYRALQGWRAALRNITQAPEFPDIDLPAKPAGL